MCYETRNDVLSTNVKATPKWSNKGKNYCKLYYTIIPILLLIFFTVLNKFEKFKCLALEYYHQLKI